MAKNAYCIYGDATSGKMGELAQALTNLERSNGLGLNSEEKRAEVTLTINCSGGHMASCLAFFDTVSQLSIDLETVVVGNANSLHALVIALAGQKRVMAANASFSLKPLTHPFDKEELTSTQIRDVAQCLEYTEEIVSSIAHNKTDGRLTDPMLSSATNTLRIISSNQAFELGIVDTIC